VIDPGRAFGTGGHPTTRLCLELLAELEPGSLVDAGCGSGVLAVAAAKLGFSPVIALDHEAAAVEATERNAAANAVELEARLVDALTEDIPAAEILVANVSAAFAGKLRPAAVTRAVLASGYLEVDLPALAGFRPRDRRVAEGWAADLYRREE
jgi:ribosomal protein L11 methyltransferase